MAKERLQDLADSGLVERVRDGDGEAFAEIVHRHGRRLRALVHRLLIDDSAADDVMQETYLRAFRAMSRFRGDASLGTWLHRIAHNVAMDHLRRRRPTTVQPADDGPEPVWSGPDPGDVACARRVAAQALGTLNAGQRAVAQLVCCDGLDYAAAAAALGLPLGTVASRLNRARAALRTPMDARARDAA